MDYHEYEPLHFNEGAHVREPDYRRLPFEDLGFINNGAFGAVSKVRDRNNGKVYALKKLRISRKVSRNDCMREANNTRRLRHVHLIKTYASYETGPNFEEFGILTKFAEQGTLSDYLENYIERPSERRASALWNAFGCLANALAFIHENRTRHCDIKPDNILISEDRVLIADFGLAFDWTALERATTMNDVRGTLRYFAPELENGVAKNQGTDVWALSCVYFQMIMALTYPTETTYMSIGFCYRDRLEYVLECLSSNKVSAAQPIIHACYLMFETDMRRRVSAQSISDRLSADVEASKYFCSCCMDQSYRGTSSGNQQLPQVDRAHDYNFEQPPAPTRQSTFGSWHTAYSCDSRDAEDRDASINQPPPLTWSHGSASQNTIASEPRTSPSFEQWAWSEEHNRYYRPIWKDGKWTYEWD